MSDFLLDTCILIDVLRGKPDALTLFELFKRPPFISVLSVAELYQGLKNESEKEDTNALLSSTVILELTSSAAMKGGILCQKYKKSHGVGLIDALIGATAELESLTLITLNKKHFPFLKNLIVPYE